MIILNGIFFLFMKEEKLKKKCENSMRPKFEFSTKWRIFGRDLSRENKWSQMS